MATQVDALSSLATALGGTKTTTSPGNTDALQQLLGQLQGTDYAAMLQSIFQQAGGQIPGLQAAFGNAIGARSGGNSAMQAALSKLLSQTTLAGQQQLATQQNQNFQTQAQAGQAIAQATKGTTQKQGADMGQAAKTLAIMKLLSETGIFKAAGLGTQDKLGQITGSSGTLPGANLGTAPDYSLAGGTGAAPASLESAFAPNAFGIDPVGGGSTAYNPMYDLSTGPVGGNNFGGGTDFSTPDFNDYLTYTPPTYDFSADYSLPTTDYESGLTFNADDWDIGFAEGGLVTQQARGGRRSSAAEVQTVAPKTTQASNTGGLTTLNVGAPSSLVEVNNALTARPATAGRGSGDGNTPGFNSSFDSRALGALNTANKVNSLSGLTGGPAIPGLSGIMGLANAKTPEQALAAAGMTGLSMASPQLASVVNFAMDPSQVKAIDIATSLNPALAIANMALGLGGTSVGQLALGAPQSVDPTTGEVREATMGLFGGGGAFGGNPAMSSPVSGWGEVATTDLGYVGNPGGGSGGGGFGSGYGPSDLGNFSEGRPSFGTGGNYGGGGMGGGGGANADGGTGDTGSDGVGGGGASGDSRGADGSNADGNFRSGGPVNGPGTGTSDSIPARLSDGEFVMSADVVDALGEDFFHQLQAAFHTPVAAQRK